MKTKFNAPAYLHIAPNWNAAKRLEALRLTADRKQLVPDWRKAREWNFRNWAAAHCALSPGFNSRNSGTKYEKRFPVMYCHTGEQFRAEQYADEWDETGVEHRGWYSDADCSRTLRAFVFRLPHGRFGCGYADSDSGERVYFLNVFDDVRDAGQFADSEAQHYAEEEKEYNERWHEARELVDANEEARKEAKRLYKLRNDNECGDECRAELRELVRVIRQREEDLRDNYKDIEV